MKKYLQSNSTDKLSRRGVGGDEIIELIDGIQN